MASSDAQLWPAKGLAKRVTFAIFKNDGTVITGATGIASTVSKDGGTFATTTNTVTEIASASGVYFLDLTATEMTADTVAVKVTSTSTGAVVVVLVMETASVPEPTTTPGWPSDPRSILGFLLALARNKITQTSSATVLRNDADSATIATSNISDDGTTFTKGEWV